MTRRDRSLLVLALALFAGILFLEFPGSSLLETDEARYAEIPREMLATGNWLVPRLNGVDYFEKPPLLYWANAVSISALGHNPFAARLPSRLATLGSVLLLLGLLRRVIGERAALLAALVCLSAPLFFALGRTNLTDGVLTFSMTLSVLAIYRFLLEREAGKSGAGWAALAGLGCGLAVLSKGLIGIVLPGGALVLWCFFMRRFQRIPEMLFSWAPLVCLAVTVPYFVAVERAAPGFSEFFWIHEHFVRYATPEAQRPGPIYYFFALFIAGFLPWTFFLGSIFRRAPEEFPGDFRGRATDLWFGSFAAFVLVFFSLSHSKLPPYILPVYPAAAVLLGRRLARGNLSVARPLLLHAIFWSVVAPVGIVAALRQEEAAAYGLSGAAVACAAAFVLSAWIAVGVVRKGTVPALVAAAVGWLFFYAALVAALPRISGDQSSEALALAAKKAAGSEAEIVCYHTYLQGFPWVLEHRLRIYGWREELEFGSFRGDQSAWFRTRKSFLRDWDSGKKIVALMRELDRKDLRWHRADLVARNRKYLVVKNF